MKVNGWLLLQYKLFSDQLDELKTEVRKLQLSKPDSYKEHPKAKRLLRIKQLIFEEIPADPGHERWHQGNTLGAEFKLWKRAKFGKNRFRLFFRYDGTKKIIIYAWVNDENTLRKEGDRNDPYAVFAKGLKKGEPPSNLADLLKLCTEVEQQPEVDTEDEA